MSIETRDSQNPETTENRDLSNCTIVTEMTVDMILKELAQGVNKTQMQKKFAYRDADGNIQSFEKWMIDEMFKDPNLRGKKPARRKVLPFTFKGTTETTKVTMTADSNGSIEVTHTVSEEPKDSIPGTEGGHQMTVPTSNNGYVEINVEEEEEEEASERDTNQYNY